MKSGDGYCWVLRFCLDCKTWRSNCSITFTSKMIEEQRQWINHELKIRGVLIDEGVS